MGGLNAKLAAAPAQAHAAAMQSIDWVRTLAARGQQRLQAAHIQRQTAEHYHTAMHCIVLDCSASMLHSGALAQAKGVLLALLQSIYQQRAHASLLCFGGQGLQWRLRTQRPPAWNDSWLAPIGGGGHSPLAQALSEADCALQTAKRYPLTARTLWLLSDGRVPSLPAMPEHAAQIHLIDCELTRIPLARMAQLAQQWQCGYQHLQEFAKS